MPSKKDTNRQTFYASEKRFRALIEKASEGIVMYDEAGMISYMSPSIKSLGGYKEGELLGLNGLYLIHPEDKAMSLEKFEEVAQEHGKTITFRQRLKHKKGEYKWCETTLTNLLNEPDVESIISNFRDISRQKAAEDQLLESKTLLESINQNINEAIYRNVPGQRFEYVNKAFLTLFGYDSLADLNKVPPSSLYVTVSARKEIQNKLKTEGTINNVEIKFRKKSGEEFWGLISSSLIVDAQGRQIFDGAIRDITSEKEAREQLRASEQMLSSINLNIKEGIYRSSFKKGLLYVNDAFVEMFGYSSKEEIANISIYDLYKNTDQRESIITHLRRIGSIRNEEILFKRKNGETFWGLMSSYVTKDKNDEFFDGAIRDISDLKQVENQLILLNTELRKQNKALAAREDALNIAMKELSDRNFELDQLVYKTSHDIRSPLTSILGLVNIAKMDRSHSKEEYLDKIEQSILKLDEFVKSMLNYAKASRVDIKMEDLELKELIEGCIKDLEYLDTFTTVKPTIKVAGGNNSFKSDPLRLKIIFSNIISNAFKYCDEKRRRCVLKINVRIQKKCLNITFEDNGIGISKEHLSKIFNMFYRGTERSEGSGLGMYIVKQSVDKLGGTIEINSLDRVGTKIKIYLPTADF